MRLRRLGKIFDATPEYLPQGCFGYAQSPQAIAHGQEYRVYFSTRQREEGSAYVRSVVGYADFGQDFGLLGTAKAPVLGTGALGTFDEHGVFPLNPVRDGNRLLGFTTGWARRVSTSVETGIGLVESHDGGATFVRAFDGPVMSASLKEPCLVADAFVLREKQRWHMWYIFGLHWKLFPGSANPERIYKIAYASSEDGVEWRRDGACIIENVLGPDECQALPSVLQFEGRYHMVFCYRHADGFRDEGARGYRLGYAHSADGLAWTRDDDALVLSGPKDDWDSAMQCYPHLFLHQGLPALLYNGNSFGEGGFGAAVYEG